MSGAAATAWILAVVVGGVGLLLSSIVLGRYAWRRWHAAKSGDMGSRNAKQIGTASIIPNEVSSKADLEIPESTTFEMWSPPRNRNAIRALRDQLMWNTSLVSKGSLEWNVLQNLLITEDATGSPTRWAGVVERWGRDVREPGRYKSLRLFAVWRIEAPLRRDKYNLELGEIRHHLVRIKEQLGVEALPHVQTNMDACCERLNLDNQAAERLLWHGTVPEVVPAILENGMNERFSDGHFGSGVYLAEDAAKMDQYVTSHDAGDPSHELLEEGLFNSHQLNHPGKCFYAFLCRTVLGHPIFTKDGKVSSNSEMAIERTSPGLPVFADPSQEELAFIPTISPRVPFHSMIIEQGPLEQGYSLARYREFLVMNSRQVLPEYLVAYVRD